jgi:hypothetical protein
MAFEMGLSPVESEYPTTLGAGDDHPQQPLRRLSQNVNTSIDSYSIIVIIGIINMIILIMIIIFFCFLLEVFFINWNIAKFPNIVHTI